MLHLRGIIGHVRLSTVGSTIWMFGTRYSPFYGAEEKQIMDLTPAEAYELGQTLIYRAIEAGHRISTRPVITMVGVGGPLAP